MASTPILEQSYQELAIMDKQIADAEAHIRVLRAANFPSALKMQSDLDKALIQRKELMTAIQNELNRP